MRRPKAMLAVLALLLVASAAYSQPKVAKDGSILFTFHAPEAQQVYLSGEFNGWSPTANPMERRYGGIWHLSLGLEPGVYQYKFVIDGTWKEDPKNPVKVDDNYGGFNSVMTVTSEGEVLLAGYETQEMAVGDDYPQKGGTIYLNILWHQHQPLYLDPARDQLQGPWVRAHATKDYYDMAAILEHYPKVHFNVNLTSSLLLQLQRYYVDRLAKFVDVSQNMVDEMGYLAAYGGKTDPWIDMALKNTEDFDEEDRSRLYRNAWNSFGVSDVVIERFPAYLALREKARDQLTVQDMREIKFWHYLAWFDPDFLRGRVSLPLGYSVDLSDLVQERDDGTFQLRKQITEYDCNRIVAEAYKVMANVVPVHRALLYRPDEKAGQIEVMTTPFYHPILPLVYDTDIAKICQPYDPLPSRFSYPMDADAQVAKAVKYYEETFGQPLRGMWPGEGSVAEAIVPLLLRHGVRWVATGDRVLQKSTPPNEPIYYPYKVDADSRVGDDEDSDALTVVFRDTPLSDKIGFRYQRLRGEAAADDFVRSVLRYAPGKGEPDRLLTVILDGENAWEWYREDNDGKEFLNALYRKLSKLYDTRQIVTVTVTEYIEGNPARGISPHPLGGQKELEPLWPGCWFSPDFATWIGEAEENKAWEYLLRARQDLAKTGITPPNPLADPPPEGTKAWNEYMAWEEIYAAEGSDWFWWYGGDQSAPGGDEPFDKAFREHLKNVYVFAQKAGASIGLVEFNPVIKPTPSRASLEKGDKIAVIFSCQATALSVSDAIYIVGNQPELADWTPNKVRMFDDGTHGDEKAGDGIWSLEIPFPAGLHVEYKYTNSGKVGVWTPSEEFPVTNRALDVEDQGGKRMVVRDTFGTP